MVNNNINIIEDTIGNKNPMNDKELIEVGPEYDEFEKDWRLDDIKDIELEDAEKDMEVPDETSNATMEYKST